jgi:hypothetical protein
MRNFRNRSPFVYAFVTLITFTIVIVVLSSIDSGRRFSLISVGLVGSGALLSGSWFIPEMKCERLVFRFLAFQSACVGFYLWGAGIELVDVREWIVGFVWTIFVLVPAVLLLIRWVVKKVN